MQRATILYLTNVDRFADEPQPEQMLAAGWNPEWTEVTAGIDGWPAPQDLMLRLAVRGATRVEMQAVELSGGSLRRIGVSNRVYG